MPSPWTRRSEYWAPDRATFEDELDAFRRRTERRPTPAPVAPAPVSPWVRNAVSSTLPAKDLSNR